MFNDNSIEVGIDVFVDLNGEVQHNIVMHNLAFTSREHRIIQEATKLLRSIFEHHEED